MKSIKQQYIDLTEGKMSQANFMRNLRMTMPQYITNVTSFKDSIRILKNKGILTENYIKTGSDHDYDRAVAIAQFVGDYNSAVVALQDEMGLSPQEADRIASEVYPEDELYPEDNIPKADKDIPGFGITESKKTKLTADQANPSELRMGIRVEMEHTDDPKKAEKIALDHLAENPFYYTQLKLSGVDTKALPSKEKKTIDKKKDETEMVDKANQMKTPKGVEKIKASANKAKKETNKPEKGIKMMSLVSKTARGVKKMDGTGEKMKTIKEGSEEFVSDRDYDMMDAEYEILTQIAMQAPDYDSAVVALEDYGVDTQLANSIASGIHKKVNVAKTIFDRNANITKGINKIARGEDPLEDMLREAIRKIIKQEIKY